MLRERNGSSHALSLRDGKKTKHEKKALVRDRQLKFSLNVFRSHASILWVCVTVPTWRSEAGPLMADSCLLPRGSQGSNSGHQALFQVELFCEPIQLEF